jgi:elongation factor G
VNSAREALIEMVAENDEHLMEKFFEAGTLTDDELVAGLRSATLGAKLFPLVCTSALRNIASPSCSTRSSPSCPSPVDRPFKGIDKAGAEVARPADEKGALSAFVWKTIADPFAGGSRCSASCRERSRPIRRCTTRGKTRRSGSAT